MDQSWIVALVCTHTGEEVVRWSDRPDPGEAKREVLERLKREGEEHLLITDVFRESSAVPAVTAPGADGPLAEWEVRLAEEADPDPAITGADKTQWNPLLANADRVIRTELEGRSGVTPEVARTLGDEVSLTAIVEPRQKPLVQPHAAIVVHFRDGQSQIRDVRGDEAAIASWLDRDGHLGSYRRAVGRGRPSSDRAAVRERLVGEVSELLRSGAYANAIAAVLQCGRDVIARLGRADEDALRRAS